MVALKHLDGGAAPAIRRQEYRLVVNGTPASGGVTGAIVTVAVGLISRDARQRMRPCQYDRHSGGTFAGGSRETPFNSTWMLLSSAALMKSSSVSIISWSMKLAREPSISRELSGLILSR